MFVFSTLPAPAPAPDLDLQDDGPFGMYETNNEQHYPTIILFGPWRFDA